MTRTRIFVFELWNVLRNGLRLRILENSEILEEFQKWNPNTPSPPPKWNSGTSGSKITHKSIPKPSRPPQLCQISWQCFINLATVVCQNFQKIFFLHLQRKPVSLEILHTALKYYNRRLEAKQSKNSDSWGCPMKKLFFKISQNFL